MDQERESYGTEVERLCGDLEVTHSESTKEGTKTSEKVCCTLYQCFKLLSLLKAWAECYHCSLKGEAVILRLQLATQKCEQEQLHQQLEWAEATVRQLETNLDLSQRYR